MTKLRVAIRSMINRRDTAVSLLLAEVLRGLGCTVRVCSQRDFTRTLKLWVPHVAVGNARGTGAHIRHVSPKTKTVFWDGEGVNVPGFTAGSAFAADPSLYDSYDRVLLWGKWSYDDLLLTCPNMDHEKVRIVGNPNLDLARFLPDHLILGNSSNSVGVLSRFRLLNFHDGTSALAKLPNSGNLESLKSQADDFIALINAVRAILDKTNLDVVIRPHPLERAESYLEHKQDWFGQKSSRVRVDNRLSFAEFAAEQKALVTPTSTSFLQAYLLQVPIVDTSVLGKTSDYNLDGELGEQWLGAAQRPETYDQLAGLVSGDLSFAQNPVIEQQLKHYCDADNHKSAVLRAAEEVLAVARSAKVPKFSLPHPVIEALDKWTFSRIKKENPNHINFCYKSGEHPAPTALADMAKTILNT